MHRLYEIFIRACRLFLSKVQNHLDVLFSFPLTDIEYLQSILPKTCRPEFFDYLRHLSTSEITLYAVPEGTVVFPRVPLLRVEGPLPGEFFFVSKSSTVSDSNNVSMKVPVYRNNGEIYQQEKFISLVKSEWGYDNFHNSV